MNALVGERGLECKDRLPQLVIDRHSRSHPPNQSSSQLDPDVLKQRHHSIEGTLLPSSDESETEMDRRLKRGRRRKGSRQNHQRSPIIATAIKQQQKIASRKAAERAKLQVHQLLQLQKFNATLLVVNLSV